MQRYDEVKKQCQKKREIYEEQAGKGTEALIDYVDSQVTQIFDILDITRAIDYKDNISDLSKNLNGSGSDSF